MAPTQRVKRLRNRALAKTDIINSEPELLWARSWLASTAEPWYIIRRAQTIASVLRGMTPVIDDDELIVGKYCFRPLSRQEQAEVEAWCRVGATAVPKDLGQKAHMAIDYDKLLRLGIKGIRRQIEEYRAKLDVSRPDELERDAFYRACLICLDAAVAYANSYADLAESMAKEERSDVRRQELLRIAATCRRVPWEPAASFYEALQTVHFTTFCLCAGQRLVLFQLGRPDRYLLPYIRRDVARGTLAPEQAQELIDCLCIMLNEYTPRGLAVGFMVGGRDASGMDVTNELTSMFIESIGHTRLSYPGIGLCWNSDTPSDLMQRACGLLATGASHPALFNDDIITAGLVQAGLPFAEACLYVHSTCVEITPIASSNVYVASPYINLVGILNDVLGVPAPGENQTKGSPVVDSYAQLMDEYYERLARAIRDAVVQQNTAQATRRYHGGYPLLSCFVNDCLGRGKDIDHGGARYNWIEPSFVGLANLVDALAAIRKLVFVQKTISMTGLVDALCADFVGYEHLRQQLVTQAPKYGNDHDDVDEIVQEITAFLVEECARYRTYLGGDFHPGLFCWIMHEHLGRVTGATADGRPAAFPLADGSGAAQGRERLGPTAALRSATKWDHRPMLGGVAVNLKFTPSQDRRGFVETLQTILEAFLRMGGFEVQVNVVDKETLLAAQVHPEQYGDLVVRVAGYSDYFVSLPPGMQHEVIMRTEHGAH